MLQVVCYLQPCGIPAFHHPKIVFILRILLIKNLENIRVDSAISQPWTSYSVGVEKLGALWHDLRVSLTWYMKILLSTWMHTHVHTHTPHFWLLWHITTIQWSSAASGGRPDLCLFFHLQSQWWQAGFLSRRSVSGLCKWDGVSAFQWLVIRWLTWDIHDNVHL